MLAARSRHVGQRGRHGQLPARAGGQRREHREALRETVLLGQERGREQHPARDRAAGTAHPPRRAQGGRAEREKQRVDPPDVEPGAGDEVGRGQHPRGGDPGAGAARLALDQPGQQREAGQRGGQRDQPQRQIRRAEHAGHRGGDGEIERWVPIRHVADRGCSVERSAGEDPVHLDQGVAFQPLDGEGIAQPTHRNGQVRADHGEPEQRGGQPGRGGGPLPASPAGGGPLPASLTGGGPRLVSLPGPGCGPPPAPLLGAGSGRLAIAVHARITRTRAVPRQTISLG